MSLPLTLMPLLFSEFPVMAVQTDIFMCKSVTVDGVTTLHSSLSHTKKRSQSITVSTSRCRVTQFNTVM
jgi:hypothetical protein